MIFTHNPLDIYLKYRVLLTNIYYLYKNQFIDEYVKYSLFRYFYRNYSVFLRIPGRNWLIINRIKVYNIPKLA